MGQITGLGSSAHVSGASLWSLLRRSVHPLSACPHFRLRASNIYKPRVARIRAAFASFFFSSPFSALCAFASLSYLFALLSFAALRHFFSAKRADRTMHADHREQNSRISDAGFLFDVISPWPRRPKRWDGWNETKLQ